MRPAARAPLILAALLAGSPAAAQGFEVETGIDVIASPQTLIEGLHRLYVGRRVSPYLSFGQGLYSAALGDAGGAFFWGFEGVAHLPLGDRLSMSFAGFVGGGGGAAQVNGDGTMLRAGVSLDYRLAPQWDLQLTAAWIRIEGAPIDGPAYGLGFRYRFGGGALGDSGGAPEFDAIGFTVSALRAPAGTLTRSGGAQPTVTLVGAEAQFDISDRTRLTLGAAGGAQGAQGYMQVTAGVRRIMPVGRLTFFAEGGIGLGGGGDVDTGSGLLVEAALGVSVPISQRFDAELSLGAMAAANGEFRAAALSLGLVRVFNRDGVREGAQRWAYSGGLSAQRTGPDFFIVPGGASYVVMQESSLDYFVGQNLYITGNAQTTVSGGVSGYAIGLVGLGYEFPISDRWSFSLEGHIGAAGGGGVNTAGGIVAGARAELDYRIGEAWRLSLGVGRLMTLESGGMSPMLVTIGAKIPFSTHR